LFLVIVLASISVGSAFAITIRLAGDVTIDGTLTTGGVIISPTITNLQSQIDAVGPSVSPDADGDTLGGKNSIDFVSSLQSCPANQVVKGFNSIGTEICSLVSEVRDINTSLVGAISPEGVSIKIGNDGFPIIAYDDTDLKVVHCTNATCSTFDSPVTVSISAVSNLELTIGGDGLPAIAHRVNAGGFINFVHCTDASCSATDPIESVEPLNIISQISMTTGSDGFPILAYSKAVPNLNVIHCTNASCSTFDGPNVVDTISGTLPIISIGSDNLPIISYRDGVNFDIKVVHCTNVSCSSVDTPTILVNGASNSDVGQRGTMTIGTDGFPILAYNAGSTPGQLKVVHCTNVVCGTADTPIVLDNGGAGGGSDSAREMEMTINNDGFPIITYINGNDIQLRVIQCTSTDCSTFNPPEIIDNTGNPDTDQHPSITIGNDGFPVLAYQSTGLTFIRIGGLDFS